MSKKKEKEKKDAPIDYQLATKNLQYTIVIKDTDIERLKKENNEKCKYILSLEDEILKLKNNTINAFDLENKLRKALLKNEKLEKESEDYTNRLIAIKKKHEEEKKRIEKTYTSEINHLRLTMDAYIEKVKLTNQLLIDKEKLEKELESSHNKNKEILFKNEENLRTLKIRNGIKFTILKNKMSENIQRAKDKVSDLNLEYMDVSAKLTLLQNHQLLIQIEYQTQQIDDLKEKNKSLEKQIYDLTKEIEIHKEVEISLAEKNKALNNEMEKSKKNNISIQSYAGGWGEKMKNKTISIINSKKDLNVNSSLKNANIKTENNYYNEEDKVLDNNNNKIYRKTISFNNIKNNNKSNFNSNINNSNTIFNSIILNSNINASSNNNDHSKIIHLEKKVIDLEKKLNAAKKEYNSLKDKNEFTEKVLQNYKKKYYGLFSFLEECLDKFFNDEELKNNKEIYVNIDSIQKGDFTSLNKEEKYSCLIILMKYLMPLMNRQNINIRNNYIDNVNVKYHEFDIPKKLISLSNRKNKKNKKYIMNTTNNFYNASKNIEKIINNKTEKNEFDPLPSIKKINLTESKLLISNSLNKNKTKNNNNKLK